jgi:hypothetical protein
LLFKEAVVTIRTLLVTATAALAFVAHEDQAKAATIEAFYSLDGGVTINPLPNALSGSDFSFSGAIVGSGFSVNVVSGFAEPDAGLGLLNSSANDTHSGSAGTLNIYLVATGFLTSGPLSFTSQFTSNALNSPGLTVTESTYLGAAGSPTTPLGSASFPPLGPLAIGSSVTSTVAGLGFTLTEEYDISAPDSTTGVNSLGTIQVSAVPGPIVGAGLPGLIAACGGLLAFARRRRREK